MTTEIKELTKSVTELSKEVAGGFATLTTEVGNMKETLGKTGDKVDEMKSAQDGCPARTGWAGMNARIKKTEEKISSDKVDVKAEVKEYLNRDDHTGNVDEVALANARAAVAVSSGRPWASIIGKIAPYIVIGLIGLGVYLGSGGDDQKVMEVLNVVHEVGAKVERLEESAAIPMPVAPAECTSEEAIGDLR